ncbi:testis, prostate and placenta-expressed protein-like isoform X1 [Biomphalaria glabrata]|uniref:Testis, prostate and placenta-expressed protein-like isoform X1 n=1 Tax=Biomphalaria glabrata TaxID=6526 RepID=A0A9W2Z7C9_BIOGL|nr:testis, prostate and placenta-expressed protein-like isoform X1 [Biomphalaria glabrata]XP_055870831.1 testis, prostate and placenta-expressed protein-like isoform X1 [Biomphalaria glabrata]
MTYCIGKDGKALRVVGPDYVHHYPTFKRVQLAAVKEKLYNPNLPTLRHEDRDNVIGRLSDEHCKTTTCCTPRDFAETEMNAFKPPVERMHCLDITRTGRAVSNMYFTPQEVQKASLAWAKFVERSNVQAANVQKHLYPHVQDQNYHFDGAAVRIIKPEIRNRRQTFQCEPQMDPNGYHQGQPTPANTNSRYRHAHPTFYRNMSGQVWMNPSGRPEHYDPLVQGH